MKEGDRASHGVVVRDDAPTCPVCGDRLNIITTQHIRTHGFENATSFKKHFGLAYLKAPSIRAEQSSFMEEASPTKNRHRTLDEIRRMSQARVGKGVGVAGKYERTKDIRERISKSVTEQHRSAGFRRGRRVYSTKAGQDVFVRSSWEARVIKALDTDTSILALEVEPLIIPYEFEGATRRYMPDLRVTFTDGHQELWEIKPSRFLEHPKNKAKFKALQAYVQAHNMWCRVITLAEIEEMESHGN